MLADFKNSFTAGLSSEFAQGPFHISNRTLNVSLYCLVKYKRSTTAIILLMYLTQ